MEALSEDEEPQTPIGEFLKPLTEKEPCACSAGLRLIYVYPHLGLHLGLHESRSN